MRNERKGKRLTFSPRCPPLGSSEVKENAGEERSPAKMKRNVRNQTVGKGLTFPEFERKQRNEREERKE